MKLRFSKTPKHYYVGGVFKRNGKLIYITEGQLWSNDRLSNFWYWKVFDENGVLGKRVYHGYGETSRPAITKLEIKII